MKKLIRNKATHAFLTGAGKWTPDCHRAREFRTTRAAMIAASKHGLRDVEIYYLYNRQPLNYDFTISLLS